MHTLCFLLVICECVSLSEILVLPNVELCWSDALFYCRDRGMDLLTVQNLEEQNALMTYLTSRPFKLTEHVWLGLRRKLMGSTWFWMSGVPMSYTNRPKGSIWQDTSPCGGVRSKDNFTWTDIPCSTPLHFICHRPPNATRVLFWSSIRKADWRLFRCSDISSYPLKHPTLLCKP